MSTEIIDCTQLHTPTAEFASVDVTYVLDVFALGADVKEMSRALTCRCPCRQYTSALAQRHTIARLFDVHSNGMLVRYEN